jgi:hypothetical protein
VREVDWAESIARYQPDIALVKAGPWDLADRKLRGSSRWQHPGDPEFDAYLQSEMLSIVDILAADGSLVIWLTQPEIEVRGPGGKIPDVPFPVSDPARVHRYNELVFELEAFRPGRVRVIDLAAYMRSLPGGALDPKYRPDGIHLTREGAYLLSEAWLAREILRTYRSAGAKGEAWRSSGRPDRF